MRLKIFTESTYTAKARSAALKYVEQKEFNKAGVNVPALLVFVTIVGVFVLLLFTR